MSYDFHSPEEELPQPQYFAVSRTKFIVLSFLTLGMYELYWFYRNWCSIRDRDSLSIRPFWRAFFAPVFFRKLIQDIDEHCESVSPILSSHAGALVVAYYIIPALWRLPDPYWLISMFSWAALLPVVSQIASINQPCPRQLLRNSQWKLRHLALGVVTVPCLVLMFVPSMNMMPSTQVTAGSRMWEHNREFLQATGLLEDDEKVLHFYSDGLLSIEDDGNMLTDSKVVSYWKDEDTGELRIETARYEEIAAVDTDYSDNFTDRTVITVQRTDGSDFVLIVSPEKHRDVAFVDALESRIP